MSYFIQDGNTVTVVSGSALEIGEKLQPGTYLVKYSDMKGYYLEIIDSDFSIPEKIYGKSEFLSERIINTYLKFESSLGVLLEGTKGCGKTLLTKIISKKLSTNFKIPTVIVNQAFTDDGFVRLIQMIDQPCVILFDEFEKIYDKNTQQTTLLTLLDGLFSSQKLFIFTANNSYLVNEFLLDRTGRIHYRITFSGVDEKFIRDYCSDNLENKENIEGVIKLSHLFTDFSFDVLRALVQEMNMYNESALESIEFLNARPNNFYDSYDVKKLVVGGEEIPIDTLCDKYWSGKIFSDRMSIEYKDEIFVYFEPNDIIEVSSGQEKYRLINKKGDEIYLSKRKNGNFNPFSLLV